MLTRILMGITTYFILGNHDETHIRNGGANTGIAIARARPDMKYFLALVPRVNANNQIVLWIYCILWMVRICFVLFRAKIYGCL